MKIKTNLLVGGRPVIINNVSMHHHEILVNPMVNRVNVLFQDGNSVYVGAQDIEKLEASVVFYDSTTTDREPKFIKFEFDLIEVGGKILEGVMVVVKVATGPGNIISIEYAEPRGRIYAEGLGAVGTADHWILEASTKLSENNDWENYAE